MSLLRQIPPVDRLLETSGFEDMFGTYTRERIVESMRAVLDELRRGVEQGTVGEDDLRAEAFLRRTEEQTTG